MLLVAVQGYLQTLNLFLGLIVTIARKIKIVSKCLSAAINLT
jgi:hypothetical protein